jgi:hypothetical protein
VIFFPCLMSSTDPCPALGIYLAVFGTLGLIPVSSATSSHPE